MLYTGRRFDAERDLAPRRAGAGQLGDASSATPWPGRWPRPSTAAGADYDLSSLVVIGSGGAILSPAVKEQLRADAAERDDDRQLRRVGDGRQRHRSLDLGGPAAGPRFTDGRAHDGARRRPAPGRARLGRRSAGWPGGATSRSATTRTRPRRRPPSAEADGVRWVVPGDFATVEADGTITLLGRGSVSHQHRRREGLPRGGRGRAQGATPTCSTRSWSACPTSAGASGSPPSCTPAAGRDARRSRTLAGPLPHDDRRLQGPPRAPPRRRDRAHPGGQARLPLGQGPRHRLTPAAGRPSPRRGTVWSLRRTSGGSPVANRIPLVDYLVLGDEPAPRGQRVHAAAAPGSSTAATPAPSCCGTDVPHGRRGHRRARCGPSRSWPSPPPASRCRSWPRSSTATAPACGATSSTSSPTPSTSSLGMKVRLATYPVGTDDEGTEAIGFGFEPPA